MGYYGSTVQGASTFEKWSLKLKKLAFDAPPGSSVEPATITVEFPLLSEDPHHLSDERKRHMLEMMTSGTGSIPSLKSFLKSELSVDGGNTLKRHHLESLFLSQPNLLVNTYKDTWEDARCHGMSFQSLVTAQVNRKQIVYTNSIYVQVLNSFAGAFIQSCIQHRPLATR